MSRVNSWVIECSEHTFGRVSRIHRLHSGLLCGQLDDASVDANDLTRGFVHFFGCDSWTDFGRCKISSFVEE